MQSAFVVQGVPGPPAPPAMHSLRGGAFSGGMQLIWQVCVLLQVVTPAAVLCGFTGSQPGSGATSGTSGVPASTVVQGMVGTASDTGGASMYVPFLITWVVVPWP